MTGALQLLGAVATVAITALGAYLVARRNTSGSVSTTDAATLWAEAEKIRSELRAEVVSRRIEVDQLRSENDRLRVDNMRLHERIGVLEAEVATLKGAGP